MIPGVRKLGNDMVVVDASYVIAVIDSEEAAMRLRPVLARSRLTSVTAGEVFCKVVAKSGLGVEEVEVLFTTLGMEVVDVSMDVTRRFPALRAMDAARRAEQENNGEKAASLSLADLCVLGYAWSIDAPVLTGDRHWSTLTAHGLSVPVYDFRDSSTTL